MNKLQSRKFWIITGVLALLMALLGYCVFRLGVAENSSLLQLAGRIIGAVEVLVLGYFGANTLGKAVPYLGRGHPAEPEPEPDAEK